MKKTIVLVFVLSILTIFSVYAGFFDFLTGKATLQSQTGTALPSTTCTDSDGDLLDYLFIKGTAKTINNGIYLEGTDFCSDKYTIVEYYCKREDNSFQSVSMNCFGGCSDGACIKTSICPESDADNAHMDGVNYYKKGYFNGNSVEFCKDASILYERGCTEDGVNFQTDYVCPNGCNDGACITDNAACTDSDGGKEYSISGQASGWNSDRTQKVVAVDYCVAEDANGLHQVSSCIPCKISNAAGCFQRCAVDEAICTNFVDPEGVKDQAGYYSPNGAGVTCEFGCSNGACLQDTRCKKENEMCGGIAGLKCCDGYKCQLMGNYPDASGTCVLSVSNIKESVKCIFDNSIKLQKCYTADNKFLCSGIGSCVVDVYGEKGTKITWKSSCSGYAYTTIDGENEYAKFECQEESCIDSDGGEDYYVKGYCYDNIKYTSKTPIWDSCDAHNQAVYEVYCRSDGFCDNVQYICPNGCNDGVCISPAGKCSETDNGMDYYTKGTLNFNNLEYYTDFCNSKGNLNELYCINENTGYTSTEYTCPNGCNDGACIQSELPPLTLAVDDQSPASDVTLISDIVFKLKEEGYGEVPHESTLFSKIETSKLDYRVTVAIYNRQIIIIVGSQSPTSHIIFANDLLSLIKEEFDITSKIMLSNDVKVSNLKELFNSNCIDSDGGLDIYVKGTVISNGIMSANDSCVNINNYSPLSACFSNTQNVRCGVLEFYCYSGGRLAQYIDCPNGCNDGACLSNTVICSDSDGGKNIYEKGTLTAPNTEGQKIDYCSFSTIYEKEVLMEYYCLDDTSGTIEYNIQCPDTFVCSDGACVSEIVEKCQFQVGMDCIDKASICSDKSQITIALRNNLGFSQEITSGYSEICKGKTQIVVASAETFSDLPYTVKNNEVFRIQLNGCKVAADEKIETRVIIDYTNTETGLSHSVKGELTGISNTCGGIIPTEKCNECALEDLCLPFGTRLKNSNQKEQYCDISKELLQQKAEAESCQNNYECLTNTCISGKCADLQQELRETRNLIQKFWDWLKTIF